MGTTENSSGYKSFTAASDVEAYRRVTINSSGQMAHAAATDAAAGVSTEKTLSGAVGTVKLFNAPGTFLMTAGAAITRGAQVFPLAAGKIDDAGTTALPLVALEAATADGDVIEVGPALKGA